MALVRMRCGQRNVWLEVGESERKLRFLVSAREANYCVDCRNAHEPVTSITRRAGENMTEGLWRAVG